MLLLLLVIIIIIEFNDLRSDFVISQKHRVFNELKKNVLKELLDVRKILHLSTYFPKINSYVFNFFLQIVL